MDPLSVKERIESLHAKIQEMLVKGFANEADEKVIVELLDRNLTLMKALYQKLDLLEERLNLLEEESRANSKSSKTVAKKKKRK